MRDHSWHDVGRRKFLRDRKRVDFYVFVTYMPRLGQHRFASFEMRYVVVPAAILAQRLPSKNPGRRGIYRFYFHFEGARVTEIGDGVADYSALLDAWELIRKAVRD